MINSDWASEIVQINRPAFPQTPDDLGLRHFLIAFKENTLEILAADFKVERLKRGALTEAIAAYLKTPYNTGISVADRHIGLGDGTTGCRTLGTTGVPLF